MNFEQAKKAFQETEATQFVDLRRELIRAAIRYTGQRGEWVLASPDVRADLDRRRTAAHDAFIDACNILSRQMAKSRESTDWRGEIGTDRKEIGDWACFVTLFVGLAAR